MNQTVRVPRRVDPMLRLGGSTRGMMADVLVALTPNLLMSVFLFGFRVLVLTAVSVAACVGAEFLCRRFMGKEQTVGDLSACVTGVLLAMCLPSTAPYWAPVIGGVFAIVVVKQFYGGLGRNFMNPALTGRMLLCAFPMMMTNWAPALQGLSIQEMADAVSTATPLSYLQLGLLPPLDHGQMLLGQHGGSFGEVSVFMILLGGGYLMMRRVISPRIPLSFVGTVALLTLLFPAEEISRVDWMIAQLCSGGLMLGAFFMATDCATSPVTPRGQSMFGAGCGALTVLLRYFGSYPDGVGWAILTMNCMVWLLDKGGLPRRFGTRRMEGLRLSLERTLGSLSEIKLVRPSRRREEGELPGESIVGQLGPWIKSALALGGTVLVMGILSFAVHRFTDLPIAQQADREQQALLAQVMPQATLGAETPYRDPRAVSIGAGYRETELMGYYVEVQTSGFGGMITMVVGVDLNGEVTGVAVLDHKETASTGARALEGAFLNQFIGRSGTLRITGNGNTIQAVSGATMTSRAITSGVNRALAVVADLEMSDPEKDDLNYTDGEA